MTAAVPTVLHTVHALPASAGGPARTVPALCEAVARTDRYRVVLLLTRRPGETNLRPDPDLVETVELDTPARPPRAALRRAFRERIAELHDRCRFAAVHDHGQWLATNRAAADAAAKFNIPRVVAPRGMLSPWARSHRKWAKRAAWWAFARRDLNAADALHATSELEADELRALGARPPIAVIPNGVHVPDPPPGGPRAGVDGDAPREALFLSRVHPKKGLPDLIDAWATLSAEGVAKGWRLRIVGPDELGHRAELERRAAAAGLGDAVTFGGPVPDAAKWALHARASLFLLPTHSENFGVVVAEALACGTPALTTTAAPWSLLESERCGWWVDPGSAPIAAALRDALARSPADLADMGARGREAVRERFGWPGIGRATADLYDRVSPPVPPPRRFLPGLDQAPHHVKHAVRRLATPLLRAAYPRGRTRTVLAGPLRGTKFVVRDAMGVAYALGRDNQSLRFLAARVSPGQTVYDVGGNRGQVALLFARAVGPSGRVVSFEPAPGPADDLERNVALNGHAQVRLVRAAAAESEGTALFDFPEDKSTQGKLQSVEATYRHDSATVLEVATATLDGVVAAGERPPDLLIIDVEGAAATVLRGARDLLERFSPAVYVELHGPEERAGVRDELLARGYRAETLGGDRVSEVMASDADTLWLRPPEEGGAVR